VAHTASSGFGVGKAKRNSSTVPTLVDALRNFCSPEMIAMIDEE
jgi:hypothetical protein